MSGVEEPTGDGQAQLRVVARRSRPPARKAQMVCAQCGHPLEWVGQNRRFGSWLASFLCPRCRSEYFYAHTWGTLLRRA
jgi:uncharacterized protein with PIN domain